MPIAFDNSAISSVISTSLTYSHTVSGSDRLLLVGVVFNTSADDIASVTYNGVALTKINEVYQGGFGAVQLWYLTAPDMGTNDIVITANNTYFIIGMSGSYTGVDQSNPIDTSDTSELTSTTVHDASITTTLDNCWVAYFCKGSASIEVGDNTRCDCQYRSSSSNRYSQY
jgi:hypothetical protein